MLIGERARFGCLMMKRDPTWTRDQETMVPSSRLVGLPHLAFNDIIL